MFNDDLQYGIWTTRQTEREKKYARSKTTGSFFSKSVYQEIITIYLKNTKQLCFIKKTVLKTTRSTYNIDIFMRPLHPVQYELNPYLVVAWWPTIVPKLSDFPKYNGLRFTRDQIIAALKCSAAILKTLNI